MSTIMFPSTAIFDISKTKTEIGIVDFGNGPYSYYGLLDKKKKNYYGLGLHLLTVPPQFE